MEYVYHMRDPKRALLFLQDPHREPIRIILDSGFIFLLEDRATDWYVFAKIESRTQEDAAHIEALLTDKGERCQYSVDELSSHPNRAFMSSGTFEQIMNGLDAFGETQRELRTERIRAKASLN
jgi:hypothetical protein